MDINDLKREFIRISNMAYSRGLTAGPGGNISCRIKGDGNVLITATGVSFANVSPDNVLVVDPECNVVEGNLKPTKEVRWHCGIYNIRKDVGGIIHSHSPAAMAYAVRREEIPKLTAPIDKYLGRESIVPFAVSGSEELARNVLQAAGDEDVKVLILEDHGTVALGKDLNEALAVAEVIEDAAKLSIYLKVLGKN